MRPPQSAVRLRSRVGWLLGLAACVSHPPPKTTPETSVPKTLPADLAPQIRTALAAAHAAPGDRALRWSIEEARTIQGWTVELYRFSPGLRLALIVDRDSPAVAYELWVPFGWQSDPEGEPDLAMRLIRGWANFDTDGIATQDVGVGRNMSYVRWVSSGDQASFFERLTEHLSHGAHRLPELSLVSNPDPITFHTLERTLKEARHSSSPSDGMVVQNEKAIKTQWDALTLPQNQLWVVTGDVDRIHLLRTLRRNQTFTRASRSTDPSLPQDADSELWPPKIPFQVKTDAKLPVMLAQWETAHRSPEEDVALRAIARILADGLESRLGTSMWGSVASGLEIRTETHAHGARLSLFAALKPSSSATVAAAHVQRALEDLSEGATTGWEVEYAQAGTLAELLSSWTALEGRGGLVSESIWYSEGLEALEQRMGYAQSLNESMIRKTARTLANTLPAVVHGLSGEDAR